jgi:hypothetical protein
MYFLYRRLLSHRLCYSQRWVRWKDHVENTPHLEVPLDSSTSELIIGIRDCARAQFSGRSSTTNAHSETGQMAVCSQTLTLGAAQ